MLYLHHARGQTEWYPVRFYMRVCLEGYRDFGFDNNTLIRAYHESEGKYHETK
jgi:hypothetical protein